jgi:hypothetical protein
VQMDGVMVHSKINDAQADAAAEAREHRSDGGSGEAVESQPIEFHGGGVGNRVVGKNGPLLENETEIVVRVRLVTFFGVRDEEAEEAQHFLHGAVGVIEKRAFLMDGEFVDVLFSGRDRLLADPGNAVLRDGNFEAVPVQGSGFREMIFEDDANAIALMDLNGRAGTRAVVAPSVDSFERRDFSPHGFGAEIEDFDGAIHGERKIGQIGRGHGHEGSGRRFGLFFVRAVRTVMAAFFDLPRRLRIALRAGAQGFRKAEKTGAECRCVLKKFSSRTAHLFLRCEADDLDGVASSCLDRSEDALKRAPTQTHSSWQMQNR